MPNTFNEEVRLSNGSYPSTLERPVQEHLGNKLREIYRVMAETPADLGEPRCPAAFEAQLNRLALRVTQVSERAESGIRPAEENELERRASPRARHR